MERSIRMQKFKPRKDGDLEVRNGNRLGTQHDLFTDSMWE